jgi:hypothetical protein
MADYAALLNAEKKKTSPSPTKDVQQVQNSEMQNTGKQENLPARNGESHTEKINTPIPPLLQNQPQKTNERTNEQKIKKPTERSIERHSFDIFTDQKMRLDELQLMLYQKHGKKPKIGSLVREAIDDLFKKYKNERKNE